MLVAFTVAIATYNGESRLPEVLDLLRSQTNTDSFSWEVLVVDNNSSDNTAKVVQNYQSDWPSDYPLNYCFESRQGLAFARQRAVEEAKGELIGFLDDDNLPTPGWVAAACTFGQKHPKAGAYGSQIQGYFEVAPPENFKRIAVFLAIIDRGTEALLYERRRRVLPPAAGLVIRKQAWRENVPNQLFLKGRLGNSMLASEDLEALSYIQNAGWEIWHNPEMQLYHKIPRHRLERDYLVSLIRGIGLARHHIRMIRLKPWQRPLAFVFCLMSDLRKLILHLIKYRGAVLTDMVAACELEFLFSSLLSPFYLFSRNFRASKK